MTTAQFFTLLETDTENKSLDIVRKVMKLSKHKRGTKLEVTSYDGTINVSLSLSSNSTSTNYKLLETDNEIYLAFWNRLTKTGKVEKGIKWKSYFERIVNTQIKKFGL